MGDNGSIDVLVIPISSGMLVSLEKAFAQKDPLTAEISSNVTEGEVAPATFSFAANVSGGTGPNTVSWNFDDGSEESDEESVSHTFVDPGKYNVALSSTDSEGETASDTLEVIVEASTEEPPQVTFKVGDKHGKVLSNGGTTTSKSIEIKFTVTDNVGVSSVECSLEGPGTRFDKPLSPCTSPIELSKLVKGKYTFTVIATDEAENHEPQTFTWTVK